MSLNDASVLAALGRRLRSSNLDLRPGTTLGVVAGAASVAIVICNAENEIRVEATDLDTEDDIAELVDETLRQIPGGTMRGGSGTDPNASSPSDRMPSLTIDIAQALAVSSPAQQVVVFAGRCLHLPKGLGAYERRFAMERFLASGTGRILAQHCSLGTGSVVLSTPPSGWGTPPDGLAVHDGQTWHSTPLGGVVGPLGTSRTLRTWTAGDNTVSTSICHVRLNSPDDTSPPVGGSVSDTAERTELLAVAEACERYLGGVIDPGRVAVASFNELGASAIDPRRFVDYATWQYETFSDLVPFSAEESRLWVDVVGLRGDRRHVLADLVFYPFGWSQHRRHTNTSSSGMAAHTSRAEARTSAVNELIERDAFMRSWLAGRRSRLLVNWENDAPERLVGELDSSGWDVRLLQIAASDEEPVLMAVGTRGRSVALGASAASPRTALRKALGELWATTTRVDEIDDAPTVPESVSSPADHTLFALAGRHGEPPTFITEFEGESDYNALRPSPTWPREVYFHEWDQRLSKPFVVVRALAPELIPISFGFGQEPYGRHDVRALVGDALPTSLDTCPPPHPFP